MGTSGLTPGTLIDGARMYAASADAVNDRYPNALHVLSHLLGMSIELALKAYLLNNGATERELRRMGHDLRLLLLRAESHGLRNTGSRRFRLGVLGANYMDRLFAYPAEGNLTAIIPVRLREVAGELIKEVFGHIKGRGALAECQSEPGLAQLSEYPEDLDASAWALAAASSQCRGRGSLR